MTTLPEIPATLKQSIIDNHLIVFAGAGISSNLGFPLWDELIINMVEAVSKEESKFATLIEPYKNGFMDTLTVLDKMEAHKRIYRDTLESVFSNDIQDISKLDTHKAIYKLSNKIITTNYDLAFESAISDLENTRVHPITNDTKKITDLFNMPSFLYKIHGSAENPDSCVLTRSDYKGIYSSESPQKNSLRNLAQNNNFLFIGFSMNDIYIQDIFSELNKIFKGYNKKAYLLTTDIDKDLSNENIQIISIENYNDLTPYLEKLIGCKEEKKIGIESEIFDIDDIDENELREFIIEFNNDFIEIKTRNKKDILEIKLQRKFVDMVCNKTFIVAFDKYSMHFDPIDEIMSSSIYVSSKNKEIIIDIVIEYYQNNIDKVSNGTQVFGNMVNDMMDEGLKQINISNPKKRIYLKILISWAIYNCDIFNEKLLKEV